MTLENWSQVATIIAAAAAVLGLFAIWLQINSAQQASNEASVTSFYTALLSKALEYPEFLAPDPKLVDTKAEKFSGNAKEFRRYESFVDLMLTTFEQMRRLSQDKATQNYMEQWVSEHLKYLESAYFKKYFLNQLSRDLLNLLRSAKEYKARHLREAVE